MAIKQIGITIFNNTKKFQALTTDDINNFPKDCDAGSTLITIDPVAKEVSKGYYFDGMNWNSVGGTIGISL